MIIVDNQRMTNMIRHRDRVSLQGKLTWKTDRGGLSQVSWPNVSDVVDQLAVLVVLAGSATSWSQPRHVLVVLGSGDIWHDETHMLKPRSSVGPRKLPFSQVTVPSNCNYSHVTSLPHPPTPSLTSPWRLPPNIRSRQERCSQGWGRNAGERAFGHKKGFMCKIRP